MAVPMDLQLYGIDPDDLKRIGEEGFVVGRVIQEHRERYLVRTVSAIVNAEITGNLRFTAESRADFPAVGDWVKLQVLDESLGIIIEIFPRKTIFQRKAVGKFGEAQIIAVNIDTAFILVAVGHDYNLNRVERYIVLCKSSDIIPVVLVSKIDLLSKEEIANLLHEVNSRLPGITCLAFSSFQKETLELIREKLLPSKTYCFLGSSGVGKSTLLNALLEDSVMKTQEISETTSKGRHTTTYRSLIELPNGSIVIDTPGMREVGILEDEQSVDFTFNSIAEIAENCRFRDCTHTQEAGCAILQAIEDGDLDEAAYENYQKLKREQARFSSSKREKRKKDKSLGKLYKSIQNENRKRKF